jgi:hypothetical protein
MVSNPDRVLFLKKRFAAVSGKRITQPRALKDTGIISGW